MFSQMLGNYSNDEQTQQFMTNTQYSSLNTPTQKFSSMYIDPNSHTKKTYLDLNDNAIAPDYIPPEVKVKNNIVLINSIDRDWYNFTTTTPYSFDVNLGGYGTNSYSVINNEYRNIISFSIDRIMLANRTALQNYSTSNTTSRLTNNPYLTVSVKNINYSSYGTNKTLNTTMGMFTPLTPIGVFDTTYLEFKNSSAQKKEYFPIPEGIITQLGIQITDPVGNIASNVNDVLSIYSIFNSNVASPTLTTGDYLVVQTNEYFTENEFHENDHIYFKNYIYHNMSFDESGIFCNYINRPEGHTILDISKSGSTDLYNRIHIPMPASLSKITGNLEVETWYTDFITKTFPSIPIEDTSGKLINANTQSHFAINIKTLEKNNNNIFLKNLV